MDEDNSRHAVQVLRMKEGEHLHLTDGKGHLITASVSHSDKKHCEVRVLQIDFEERAGNTVSIAISPTKNTRRFEWLLEKAAEIGIHQIIPLITKRTEKQRLKEERLQNILISALLQSRQRWLLHLHPLTNFDELMANDALQKIPNKYIAHCIDTSKQLPTHQPTASITLIGPEGDFTPEEIATALRENFAPISLGRTRLRTETAGIVAATLLKLGY